MTISIKTTTFWRGEVALAKEHRGAVKGLEASTEHLLGESRDQVPIEEATLERSGVASVDESKLEGAVSYDTEYAVVQHEALNYHHDAGRKAKYLEDPFYEEIPTFQALIAAELRKALR